MGESEEGGDGGGGERGDLLCMLCPVAAALMFLMRHLTAETRMTLCLCVPQLQSSITEFEFSQEDYRQLQVEFWSKFYACCLQYQEALAMPVGLTVSSHTSMVCLLKKVQT